MFEVVYTLATEAKKAIEELKDNKTLEANLAVFFVTENLQKNIEKFKFDCDSIAVPVEAILTPEGVYTRGCLSILFDSDVEIENIKGGPKEVSEKLKKAKKGKFNFLIYPLMYIENRLQFMKLFLQQKVGNAEKVGELCERIIYPMNALLRPFKENETVSLNIFPLKIGIGGPAIVLNGEKIGRSVVYIRFNEKVDCKFEDFLPERGKSFGETSEIIGQIFGVKSRVKVKKKDCIVEAIEGKPVWEYLREQKIWMRENLEDDMEKSKFFGATPYGLYFISQETKGSAALGLMDYNVKFYPSLFDLEKFYDEALFVAETVKPGLDYLSNFIQEADFAFIDQNFLLMFEGKILDILGNLKFGVFTSYPSYAGKSSNRITEIEKNVHVNTMFNTVFLKFY